MQQLATPPTVGRVANGAISRGIGFRRSLSFDARRSRGTTAQLAHGCNNGATPDADWQAQLEGHLYVKPEAAPRQTPIRRSFSFTRGVSRGSRSRKPSMVDSGAPESGSIDLLAARTAELFVETEGSDGIPSQPPSCTSPFLTSPFLTDRSET
uniref:Uncharacterized protein n=1 Tax=Haptolina brevifila TaxID=156173 RepID=A0A7S2BRD5_9EUKA